MFLTIFTSTYNRRDKLPALYASLKRQTDMDFEWIIVDDGSTDATWEELEAWKREKKPFVMRAVRQENGGKHRAMNRGIAMAKGQYFMGVDSDDFLLDDAVEKVHRWCAELDADPAAREKKICGVVGLRMYPDGKPIGGAGDGRKVIDASTFERKKFHLEGDKAEVFQTQILRQYPFPEFPGENFLSEGVVFNRMAMDGYRFRYHIESLKVCEYLQGGLTDSLQKNQLRCFQGFTIETREAIRCPRSWRSRMATIAYWTRLARQKGLSARECAKELDLSMASFCFANFVIFCWRKIKPYLPNMYTRGGGTD